MREQLEYIQGVVHFPMKRKGQGSGAPGNVVKRDCEGLIAHYFNDGNSTPSQRFGMLRALDVSEVVLNFTSDTGYLSQPSKAAEVVGSQDSKGSIPSPTAESKKDSKRSIPSPVAESKKGSKAWIPSAAAESKKDSSKGSKKESKSSKGKLKKTKKSKH